VDTHDAVIVGAGPNGLVAANLLVDAGWDVLVLEAQPEPGGAVRTAEVTAPGFRNDLFSAFYPLAACSSVLAGLDLEGHGLEWTHSPAVVAHPVLDGRLPSSTAGPRTPRPHWSSSRRVTATPGSACSPAGDGSGTRCWPR
jgi:phytoene dehydrogenase-like protein